MGGMNKTGKYRSTSRGRFDQNWKMRECIAWPMWIRLEKHIYKKNTLLCLTSNQPVARKTDRTASQQTI